MKLKCEICGKEIVRDKLSEYFPLDSHVKCIEAIEYNKKVEEKDFGKNTQKFFDDLFPYTKQEEHE
tara:strand:+ start:71 stop:268 length:198 start_codon:yes stop_codon:yes gene_type:complete